ncbi:hypothetical protein TrVE_jg1680 [Triparma verrucosa]|uniref:Core domain-containing protein n=1 Tax=Triparma verrucosa TaxID=1606542 RepID=A0A9W7KV28_9STRA|nr:hypothetical protein TrVE_jg1680 [Triparma verrucosa]
MDIKQLAAVLLEVIQENRDLKSELATLRSDFQSLSSSVTDLKSSVSDLRMKTGTLITKTSLEQKRNTQQRATVEQWKETVEGRQRTLEANMEELKNLVKFGPPPLAHLSAIKKDEELENEKKKGRISPKQLIAISPVKPGRSHGRTHFQFDNSEAFFSRLRDPEETKVSQPSPPVLSPSQNDFALNKLLNSGYTISAKSIFEIPSHNDKLHLLSDLKGLAHIRRSYESERLRLLSSKVQAETEARVKLESSIKFEKALTSKLSNAARELTDAVASTRDKMIPGARINKLSSLKGTPQRLRISVDAGGCSGFEYVFEMESPSLQESDDVLAVCSKTEAEIITDPSSLPLIEGSTIDFEESLIRSAFAVVSNPHSESACGCGSSFALKNFESSGKE